MLLNASQKVEANVRASPSIKEATAQIERLKADYLNQTVQERARFERETDALEAEREHLLSLAT